MSRSPGLYVVGPPGVGKSTVVRVVIDYLGLATGAQRKLLPDEPGSAGALRAEPLEDIISGEELGLYLGLTREPFPGSDALGLNTHPTMIRWSDALADEDVPQLLISEGARFGTVAAFASLARWCDLRVVHLDCPEKLAAARREDRNTRYPGSGRHGRPTAASPSYVKTQRTKARKAAEGAVELGLATLWLQTDVAEPPELAEMILDWWGPGGW